MALRARTAASFVALVVLLASPLAMASPSRALGAKPKKRHAAHHRVRSQAPTAGATRARGKGEVRDGSQVASDPNAVVRWEDRDGTVHYAHRYEVPQRFRPEARHVYTSVGTVPLDRAEPAKSPASLDGTTSVAPLPVVPLPPALRSAAGASQAPPSATPQSPPSGTSQSPPSGTPQTLPSGTAPSSAPQESTTGAPQIRPGATIR